MKFDNYIGKFASSGDVQTALNDGDLIKPYIALVEGEGIDYNSVPSLSEIPLTFEILGDGNINWKASDASNTKTIEYSKNGGEWTEITSSTEGAAISVVSGDTVQFRGNNTSYATSSNYNYFGGSVNFKVKGNIMSLIDSTNFSTLTTLSSAYTFSYLFNNCTGLTDASNLILPATTLANYCYDSMFDSCTSLTTAPELPATTLADGCYAYMFCGCTSLTTAPELPATTLASECYQAMFANCTSLNYIKCLATSRAEAWCTSGWVSGVASSGTFVKNPNMTSWTTGQDGIPSNWTVIDAE